MADRPPKSTPASADEPTRELDAARVRDDPSAPPDAGFGTSDTTSAPPLPTTIGQFRIKRLIATGGMGSVYEAMQEHPRRSVAIKVMKHGISSKSALRRFEYESQILARLRHSGIAQVYEAGTHDDGSGGVPYFAMEYIPNARSVTEFARAKNLGTRERLNLFAQICDAVHHGHQKGIIHRDLKPANLLVDSAGHVKIIDFGVARATDSDLAVTTLQTDVGQLIGTLQYMSPEQVEADPNDIDTRSDIYALGVVLYELLTRKLPYDVSTVTVFEAVRMIREKPATRLSIADRTLRGDLETIVMTAMEKDRDRRYQSAAEFGRDVSHYLNLEPISARPPSLVYLFRSFARRHRAAFGTVALVFAALVLGIIGTTWGLMEAQAQRDDANRARIEAVDSRDEAQREARKATQINDFLKGMLSSVDPRRAQGQDLTVRDLLDDAAANIDTLAPGEPELEADLRATIGSTYRNLGLFAEAEMHHRTATEMRRQVLGDDHPVTLTSQINLALVLQDLGKYDEAERRLRDLMDRLPLVLGAEHSETIRAQNNLAWLLQSTGRPAEAEPLYLRCYEASLNTAGEADPMTIKYLTNHASSMIAQGRPGPAEPVIDKAVALALEHLGPRHPDTLYTESTRAWMLSAKGETTRAADLYRDILTRAHSVLGADHPHAMFWENQLAWMLNGLGEFEEAITRASALLDTRRRVLGEDHPDTIESHRTLAAMYVNSKQFAPAEEHYAQAATLATAQYGADDARTLAIRFGRAWNAFFDKRLEEAEQQTRDTLGGYERLEGTAGGNAQACKSLLVSIYQALGRPDEAKRWRDAMAEAAEARDPTDG